MYLASANLAMQWLILRWQNFSLTDFPFSFSLSATHERIHLSFLLIVFSLGRFCVQLVTVALMLRVIVLSVAQWLTLLKRHQAIIHSRLSVSENNFLYPHIYLFRVAPQIFFSKHRPFMEPQQQSTAPAAIPETPSVLVQPITALSKEERKRAPDSEELPSTPIQVYRCA